MKLTDLFGDNSSEYSDLADALRNIGNTYNPYITAGQNSLKDLIGRYSQMMNDPAFLENKLASEYKPSAYAQTQQRQTADALNNNAAALGTLGSSYAAQTYGQNMNDLLNRDMQNYIGQGEQMYGQGLAGEQGVNKLGYNALGQQNQFYSQGAQDDAQAAMSKQNAFNQMIGQGLGLAGDFFTGGTGGLSSLLGNMGSKAGFGQQGGDQELLNAIQTLKKYGFM